jgi:hypothetical protein
MPKSPEEVGFKVFDARILPIKPVNGSSDI